jgi:hypothetical protein
MLHDWRWYKEAEPGNQWAIDAYWQLGHNLHDYRLYDPEHDWENTIVWTRHAKEVRYRVCAYERGDKEAGFVETITDPGWFGRGQQYLSFVRMSDET